MKIKITQITTVIYEPDMDAYDEADRSKEGIIRVETENAEEYGTRYMDLFEETQTVLKFEHID